MLLNAVIMLITLLFENKDKSINKIYHQIIMHLKIYFYLLKILQIASMQLATFC